MSPNLQTTKMNFENLGLTSFQLYAGPPFLFAVLFIRLPSLNGLSGNFYALLSLVAVPTFEL